MIDPARIGALSMELMEGLEKQFGDDTELVTILVAVEVKYRDDEGDESFSFQWADSGPSLAAKRGLVEFVKDGLTFHR